MPEGVCGLVMCDENIHFRSGRKGLLATVFHLTKDSTLETLAVKSRYGKLGFETRFPRTGEYCSLISSLGSTGTRFVKASKLMV